MRKWLVEETGEVRRVNNGEYFCLREMQAVRWYGNGYSEHEYPILKVIELLDDWSLSVIQINKNQDNNFDEWNW